MIWWCCAAAQVDKRPWPPTFGEVVGRRNLSTAWRAASTATGAKFLFGLHQTSLRPHAHGLVVAHHFAVEQLRQGALDAFIDAREALLLDRDGGEGLFVGDGVEDDGISLGISPSAAASLAS